MTTSPAPQRLPLFPLGTVLFPGLVLPLHVFEERYRQLVRDLVDLPQEQRRFGVIAIRSGHEVGEGGVSALHDVGCVAQVRQVEGTEDGRFLLVSSGVERFRLEALDGEDPYPRALVTLLADEMGGADSSADEGRLLAAAVRRAYAAYVAALGRASGEEVEAPELPGGALAMGYAVAATVLIDLEERQRLLAAVDGTARLRAELALLRREVTLLGALPATPAPELARGPVSLN